VHSYASLVHTLGCIDSHASIRILESLRLGEYDLALLGSSHTSQATASIDSVYPWEDVHIEYQHQSEPNSNILPSIYTSLSVRYTGATYSAMQLAGIAHPSTSAHDFTAIYKPLPKE